ncbi:MAG: Ig domain-containing protein [Bacteroidia bacterium]|nr:Ig domain-containing protein [Bacteroidia bacterium]
MKHLIKSYFSIAALLSLLVFTACETNKVTSVVLDKTEASLMVGDTDTLTADVDYSGSIIPAVIWSSSDETIISVKDGVVTALKVGSAVITATASDKSASCTITVTDELKPVFTNAEIQFYGHFYNDSLNNFVLMLTNTNDTLYLDLNTDTTATTGLPAGKYTMLGDFEYFEDFTPMSIIPAFEFEGSSYGSWFFNKVSERPLAEGEMNVSLNGTQYTIGFALTDYDGIKVNGTYSGPAVFNDYSEQMEVIANSSAAKIPGVKHRRTFGLFK